MTTTTIGTIIKKKRTQLKLTQAELADGICTQATISNLEKKGNLPSISILLKITERLSIEFNEVYEYTLENQNKYSKVFKEIRHLCGRRQHKKAFQLLAEEVEFNQLDTIYEMKQYYYYMGITSLIGFNEFSDAIYYFNQALASDSGKSLDFLDVCAVNGIGVAYDENNEYDKALTYFEKSISQLDDLLAIIDTMNNSLEIAKIYYNTAAFYSKIGRYTQAINLCSLGIQLLQNESLSYFLDYLFYEKAFNLMKIGKQEEAEKHYLYALVLADIDNNQHIIDVVKSDLEKYNLNEYNYVNN